MSTPAPSRLRDGGHARPDGGPGAALGPAAGAGRGWPWSWPSSASAGGAVYATSQALGGVSIAAVPVVTPWARQQSPAAVIISIPTPSPSPSPSPPPSATPGASHSGAPRPTATPRPTPTPKPRPFAMDLYEAGDFVGEMKDTWCVPAAMQTSMNIMDVGADVTKATQTRLWKLAYSIAPGKAGGADPEGWAKGLTQLGYGNYAVDSQATLKAAVQAVARQIRLTNRPAGLVVWYGWHSWVVSGFTATADPALTDRYTVTALRIEDVWYNRFSTIWGWSQPPDTLVPVSNLSADFKPWKQGTKYPGKDGRYVIILPVN